MLSARELVWKLKEGKEGEEEKGDDGDDDQCDFGSNTSGWDWRAGAEENGGKKVQIQNQLKQDRYQLDKPARLRFSICQTQPK